MELWLSDVTRDGGREEQRERVGDTGVREGVRKGDRGCE